MAESLECFPRGRVRARVIANIEEEVGSLPMVLITPIVAAVAGAVVTFVYTPAERVHNGLVETPSLWTSLGLAAVGAAIGIVLVITLLGLWFWLSYLVSPERSWGLGWTDGPDGRAFELFSKANPPVRAIDLAKLEIRIKRLDGSCDVVGGETKLFPGAGPAWVFEHGEISTEPRRARVYSLQPGKRPYEVLRTTIRAADPGVVVPHADVRLRKAGIELTGESRRCQCIAAEFTSAIASVRLRSRSARSQWRHTDRADPAAGACWYRPRASVSPS